MNTQEFLLSFSRKKDSALDNIQNYNYSIYHDTGWFWVTYNNYNDHNILLNCAIPLFVRMGIVTKSNQRTLLILRFITLQHNSILNLWQLLKTLSVSLNALMSPLTIRIPTLIKIPRMCHITVLNASTTCQIWRPLFIATYVYPSNGPTGRRRQERHLCLLQAVCSTAILVWHSATSMLPHQCAANFLTCSTTTLLTLCIK
jgi:hypothetical protein